MTLNCKGNLIDISTPKVMGILNITPDSFYDGGRYKSDTDILNQVETMLNQDATFIDIGAYSSRPGADHISEDDELKRIVPVIEFVASNFPETIISVDTFRAKVARLCIDSGAAIINDISAGLLDDDMLKVLGKLQVPFVMMHMRGTPQNMMSNTNYEDLLKDVIYYFSERISAARSHNIFDIIIDPGFGFSKTLEQNYQLLNKLDLLSIIDEPILVGLSRKSMIYKSLETEAMQALNGTTALNTIALMKGAQILRVHDVKEAQECITLYNQLVNS